jgi:hypothetical protein
MPNPLVVRLRAPVGLALCLLLLACGGSEPKGAAPAEAPAGARPAAPPPAAVEPKAAPPASAAASTAASTAAPATEPPVAAGPLTGTAFDKAFTPKSAIAREDPQDSSRKRIIVYDKKVDCQTWSKETEGQIEVSVSVPWKAGASADLDTFATGIIRREKGAFSSVGNLKGRAELVGDLPAKAGNKGKARIRVIDRSTENKVEGEVEFVLCDG